MTTIVNCPQCRRALQVPEDLLGKKAQCPDCKNTFVASPPEAAIQIAAPPPVPVPTSAPPATEPQRRRDERDDDDDDRRRRRDDYDGDEDDDRRHRRDRDDDDDLEDLRRGSRRDQSLDPDRGGVILTLGIVSLVLSFFSFMLYFLPIWIVPAVLGIIGWIMGYRDMRAMREGTMDRTNQVMSQIGMILSIVGLCISLCVAVLSCAVIGLFGVICGMGAFAPPPPAGPRGF